MSETSPSERWRVKHYLGSLLSQEETSDIAAKEASMMRLLHILPPLPPKR